MGDEEFHILTNSFLAVRLLALHELPPGADQGVGPFLVVQRGLDPEDPEVIPADFLLTRRGTWLQLEAFVGLGWEEGRELACFPSAAEVITLLEELPTRPSVDRLATRGAGGDLEAEAGDDAFFAAVLRAVRG